MNRFVADVLCEAASRLLRFADFEEKLSGVVARRRASLCRRQGKEELSSWRFNPGLESSQV